jgi:predicted peptidase
VTTIAVLTLLLAETAIANDTPKSDVDDAAQRAAAFKLSTFLSEDFIKLLEPGEFTVHQNGRPSRTLYYRLFRPVGESRSGKLPLIVWMHGHGDDELNLHNVGQFKYVNELVFPDLSQVSEYQFYLLAVQCPQSESWTSNAVCDECQTSCDAAEVTTTIVGDLVQRLPIDEDRIYLVGISSGGTASWEVAKRHPNLFAAVAPLASAGGGVDRLERLKDVPIWAFHVTDDEVSVTLVRSTIDQLQQLGGNCALTETSGHPHDCWGPAFLQYHLLDWLLAQRRGARDCPPPGDFVSAIARSGTLGRWLLATAEHWPQLLAVAAVVAIAWVVRRERSRFRAKEPMTGAEA